MMVSIANLKMGIGSALVRVALLSIGFILSGVVSAEAQPAAAPLEPPAAEINSVTNPVANSVTASEINPEVNPEVNPEINPVTDAVTSPVTDPVTDDSLDLDPETIQNSPVLQRWLNEVPDVRSQIRSDPSFRTRLRLLYSQYPASEQAAGILIGVEDVFIGRSPLTISAQYAAAFDRPIESYGADLHYYVLPLGSSVNIAPTVGYRHIEAIGETTEGVNVGVRLLLALSRTGAADIVISQSWVAPGTESETGLTTLSIGYAVTPNLRLSADVQQQNAPQRKDSRVGVGLEWMP